MVLVPKNNGKWRRCVNYTNLNKACSKDNYPLPCIDQLVDLVLGHEVLFFLDAYSGYNQILIHLDDVEKTTFITEHGPYCYMVMAFGLKKCRCNLSMYDGILKGKLVKWWRFMWKT